MKPTHSLKGNQSHILEMIKLYKNIEQEINLKKQQMHFFVASCLLDMWQGKGYLRQREYFECIRQNLPNDLNALTEIFVSLYNFETIGSWGSWEDIPTGTSFIKNPLEKFANFYVIAALKIMGSGKPESLDTLKLNTHKEISILMDTPGRFSVLLKEIKTSNKWDFIIKEEKASVDGLTELLIEAKQKQEEEEKEEKRKKDISDRKIEEFKDRVLQKFYDQSTMRKLFMQLHLYEDAGEECLAEDIHKRGLFQVDDKAAFFDEWHIEYSHWGSGYGSNIARFENSLIIEMLAKKCVHRNIKQFDNVLADVNKLSELIIITANKPLFKFFYESKRFKNVWQKNMVNSSIRNMMDGYYSYNDFDIPLFHVHHREEKYLLLLNKQKIGVWTQFSPLLKDQESNLKKDIFCMSVRAFSENEELIDQLQKQPPKWLTEIGTTEKQRNYLKERVLIDIYERFKFAISEDFWGVLFTVQ